MANAHPSPWCWQGASLRPTNPDPERSAVHTVLEREGGTGFLGSDVHATCAELDACYELIRLAPVLRTTLAQLLDVCERMDAEQPLRRPTEDEYQHAMTAARRLLAAAPAAKAKLP